MTKNISSRVTSHRTVFNYFANFNSLLKSVPIAVTYPEIFWETDFSKSFGGGCDTPDRSRTKPWWGMFSVKMANMIEIIIFDSYVLVHNRMLL